MDGAGSPPRASAPLSARHHAGPGVQLGKAMLVPLPCPIPLFRQRRPPWLGSTEPERSWHSPRSLCRGCGTVGGPKGCWGQGDGRAAGLGTVPLPGRWWQRLQLCQPCKNGTFVSSPGKRAGARPRAAPRPGSPPGDHGSIAHRDGCWAASAKMRLKPRGRTRGSPWPSPSRRGSTPGGPPHIAARTGRFFRLRPANAGSAPSCPSGARVAFEELWRAMGAGAGAQPLPHRPQWALCARRGEAESNYRQQRGGTAASSRPPKPPSPPARGTPAPCNPFVRGFIFLQQEAEAPQRCCSLPSPRSLSGCASQHP